MLIASSPPDELFAPAFSVQQRDRSAQNASGIGSPTGSVQRLRAARRDPPARGSTNAEKSLAKTDRAPVVKNIRQLLHQTLEADSRAVVERLTGREVVAFISGNHLDPDIAADLFILDPPFDSNRG